MDVETQGLWDGIDASMRDARRFERERRLAAFYVMPEILGEMVAAIAADKWPPSHRLRFSGLPKDAVFVAADWDWERRSIRVVVASSVFEPLSPALPLPDLCIEVNREWRADE